MPQLSSIVSSPSSPAEGLTADAGALAAIAAEVKAGVARLAPTPQAQGMLLENMQAKLTQVRACFRPLE